MGFKQDRNLTVKISDLAFGGQGVSRISHEGSEFVIFVDQGVPGDTAEIFLTKIKKNYAEGRITRRVEDSKLRVPARCKHFGVCGGCQWQFLKYEDQLRFKEKQVLDALTRIGGLVDIPLLPILESPSPWFYRNKMEYSFAGGTYGSTTSSVSLRGALAPLPFGDSARDPQDPRSVAHPLMLGLHPKNRYAEVFDLEECYLQSQFAVQMVLWMKEWANKHKLSAYDPRRNKGLLRNFVIREARSTGESMVDLVTSHEPFQLTTQLEKDILKAFPNITSLYHTAVIIKKGFRTVVSEKLLAGKPALTEIVRIASKASHYQMEGSFLDGDSLLSLIFDIRPQAFFQPNSKAAEVLLGLLLSLARPRTDDVVYDLYCGTGLIGMFFAKLVKKVYGIELNESALESARENAKKNGLTNIEFLCGDVGKTIEKIPEKPTLVVVDPPRAGLTLKALEHILELSPPKILYVSCNPATLARDLKILLENVYTLKAVQPIDLFPQTYHIETLCLLTKSPRHTSY